MSSEPATKQQIEVLSLLKAQSSSLKETKDLLLASLARVETLESEVRSLKSQVSTLNKDVFSLKDQLNTRNQADKACIIRVFGFPVGDEEAGATDGGDSTKKRFYDRLLKPVLTAAKTAGDIATVPHAATAVASFYRAGKVSASSNSPPPLVITLANQDLKLAVLRHKRRNLPLPPLDHGPRKSYGHLQVHDRQGPDQPHLPQAEGPPEA